MTATLLLLLLLASHAHAHGFVSRISVNGQTFKGNTPNEPPDVKSIIRQISDPAPVKGAANPAVNCGTNAQLAATAASVQPGDTMHFFWVSEDPTILSWPHNTGPMLAYMTKCDDADCTTFNSSSAQWFKIHEEGRIPGNKDGNWTQNLIFDHGDVPANVTLPPTLAPGAYLIRAEIIALQNAATVFPGHPADALAGAEFYPSCAQLVVGGNETGAPSADELVLLPGAYTDTEPGILIDPYDNIGTPYPFPGPPVAKFAAASAASSSTASSAPKPTSTGSCKKKRRNAPRPPNRAVLPQGPIDPELAWGYMN
ncbi:glycoside hydrolase family 61 protein [Mycena maculata]|uniref:AA9 family lytic polysaccharide monooxygenase n=1 Tax=Mycena maculata TaxID=230809 RepID=A0AAD7JH15_9AGAR|nr:glycoside hydrolase family 61 protein [Mycena maculata]